MSEVSVSSWSCEFQDAPSQITVGQELKLHCTGDTAGLNEESVQFQFPEAESFKLVRLRTESWDANNANLIVTSYRPGAHTFTDVTLSDGEHKAQLQAGHIEVVSVMDPAHPMEKPFGPLGPFKLALPWWLWLVLLFAVLSIALRILVWVRRRNERKAWLQQIEETKGALSPFNAFNKTLRALNREYPWGNDAKLAEPAQASEFVKKLSEAFKLYLAQELLVPVHRWTLRATEKELRKSHSQLFAAQGAAVLRLLKELERAENPVKPLSEFDCSQLAELCRVQADKVWRLTEMRGAR